MTAVSISFLQSCVYILTMMMLCGPAATLAGTMSWRPDHIIKAKAFRDRRRSSFDKSLKGKLKYLPLLYQVIDYPIVTAMRGYRTVSGILKFPMEMPPSGEFYC